MNNSKKIDDTKEKKIIKEIIPKSYPDIIDQSFTNIKKELKRIETEFPNYFDFIFEHECDDYYGPENNCIGLRYETDVDIERNKVNAERQKIQKEEEEKKKLLELSKKYPGLLENK